MRLKSFWCRPEKNTGHIQAFSKCHLPLLTNTTRLLPEHQHVVITLGP
jgi:hypothetical protein